jgi:hypothetical protein
MIYQIKVKGALDQSWSNWLGDIQLLTHLAEDGSQTTTLIANLADQPALFGVLDRIRDLNLVLISVIGSEEKHPMRAESHGDGGALRPA